MDKKEQESDEEGFIQSKKNSIMLMYNLKKLLFFYLNVNKTYQTAGSDNARFFRDGVKAHPLKNTSAQQHLAN